MGSGVPFPAHPSYKKLSAGLLHETELWAVGKPLPLRRFCGLGPGAAPLRWAQKAAVTTSKSYHSRLEEAPPNRLLDWLFVSSYLETLFSKKVLVGRWRRSLILPNPKTARVQIHLKFYVIRHGVGAVMPSSWTIGWQTDRAHSNAEIQGTIRALPICANAAFDHLFSYLPCFYLIKSHSLTLHYDQTPNPVTFEPYDTEGTKYWCWGLFKEI